MFGARLKIIRPAATDLLLLSLAGRHDSKPSSSNRLGAQERATGSRKSRGPPTMAPGALTPSWSISPGVTCEKDLGLRTPANAILGVKCRAEKDQIVRKRDTLVK
jgi:hypothetical protein